MTIDTPQKQKIELVIVIFDTKTVNINVAQRCGLVSPFLMQGQT